MKAETVLENRIDRVRPDAPELAGYGMLPVGVMSQSVHNRDQVDILNVKNGAQPRYDRPLTLEIWYPAAKGTIPGGQYDTLIRDGKTPTRLTGQAPRDADHADGNFPLVVISHGYPGNRLLMSHLGETLASKGYVVASVDHTDSTYADKAEFGSTLVNRPLDQRFVIDCLAVPSHPLAAITDTARTGVIGYSMGAYGALVFGGAGVSQAAVEWEGGAPEGLLARHLAGSAEHRSLVDERVRCIVPVGPWGAQRGMWDAAGLAGLGKPALIIGGSRDVTSGYQDGIRRIFTQTTGTKRHLLTFQAAGHNAAAPIPAPRESWAVSPHLDFVPFEHYADAVWDTVRMNNITQHFITAFLGVHLRGETALERFLGLKAGQPDPLFAPEPDGADWPGFPTGSALGLSFETRLPGR